MIGFFTFLAVCLLSRLDISIRHFMMPIALLILMLAPLPNMIAACRKAVAGCCCKSQPSSDAVGLHSSDAAGLSTISFLTSTAWPSAILLTMF